MGTELLCVSQFSIFCESLITSEQSPAASMTSSDHILVCTTCPSACTLLAAHWRNSHLMRNRFQLCHSLSLPWGLLQYLKLERHCITRPPCTGKPLGPLLSTHFKRPLRLFDESLLPTDNLRKIQLSLTLTLSSLHLPFSCL